MTRTLRSTFGLGLTIGASLLGATPAFAQWGRVATGGNNGSQSSQLLFEWQGNVDRETQFQIGQRGINVRGTQSNESRGRFVTRGSLPSGNGTLYVQRVSGRGNVDVIQQPGYNSGDGVVRIMDQSGGQGYYDIRVYWQPSGTYSNNGEVYGNGNGGYDRGRDGSYDRNRDVARDRNGNVVRDRHGNVVYERNGNQYVVRDRNGNVVFDRNGYAVYDRGNNGRDRRDDRRYP
ncbi:MAG: hypothetical protein JO180_00735 [Gemmatirosa sp.]|nr:hypothetical protein [Gemmatirosa sp.]